MIDIESARTYLKADGDDDDEIVAMIAGATTICENYCNRVFYADADARNADFTQALADRTTAIANRNFTLSSITGTSLDDSITRNLVTDHYIQELGDITQRVNGIVIDDAIEAAILITLGHLYVNREDNLATGNNVVQVPVGAQRILQSKLWIGNLVDGGVDITDCSSSLEGS